MQGAAGEACERALSGIQSISAAIEEIGVGSTVAGLRDLSGGCIHSVVEIALEDGRRLVAKRNRSSFATLFAEEAASLAALAATDTVLVPTPLVHGVFADEALLIMTAIEPGRPSERAWARLGEDLAALHRREVGQWYGLDTDNHIGTTPQPNGWCDDWVTFNAERRLGHQLRLARDSGALHEGESRRVQAVIDRLETWIPRHPHPALLHGDLWSGNAIPGADGRIAVIDPACSIGDGWADIAMMRLFGGFSEACFATYADAIHDHDRVEERVAVYQLYHVLNHVNLFGRGYVEQAMRLVDVLL